MLISVCKLQTAIAGRMKSRKRENQIWHNLEREPEIYNYENEWVEGEGAACFVALPKTFRSTILFVCFKVLFCLLSAQPTPILA